GDAETVLNVGAGTGNYEPCDRYVVALEPSATMRAQRPPGTAPAIRGYADDLPFDDDAFDAVLSVFSDHHWADRGAGLAELRRVARSRVVLLTFEPSFFSESWLCDYLPGLRAFLPPWDVARVVEALGGDATVEPVPLPHDCADEFMHTFWRRPEALLEPEAADGISLFRRLEPGALATGLQRLRADLDSGAWEAAHPHLVEALEHDIGIRLVVARP
ncbi:MAG: methyltransferase domain-containing protein, partial [Solirubrobacteraceae bacterium]|nr:methyltransferase domain-containing protein [Solirubrobacteraceae bacterium]